MLDCFMDQRFHRGHSGLALGPIGVKNGLEVVDVITLDVG